MSQEKMKPDYHRNIKLSLGLFQLDSWRKNEESQLNIEILWQIVYLHLQKQEDLREFVLKIFWGLIAIDLTKKIEREG